MKHLLLLIIFFSIYQNSLFSQYNWDQVLLPDTIAVKMIAFDTTGKHFLATDKGVFFSENGYQWEQSGLNDYVSLIYINEKNTVFAGMDNLFRSYDDGVTWDLIFNSLHGGIMSICTVGDSIICLGTWGGIYKSTDYGQTWSLVLFAYNSEVFTTIESNDEGVLFAGSINYSGDYSPGGVYRSDDNGSSWNLVGLEYHFVSSIVINSENEIYAGTRGQFYTGTSGVYKSTDNGVNWQIMYENNLVADMAMNDYDEIAIGCDSQEGAPGGIFCSYDDGGNWEEITNNLPTDTFDQIIFRSDNHLYTIPHFDDKLYKTQTAVNIPDYLLDGNQKNTTVFPNPAHDEIQILICNNQKYEIAILDIFGHIVINSTQNISTDPIKINIHNLNPGLYFIQCKSNQGIESIKFVKY
jgi:photosystem II stability/assembly factor-like uncharacterized protein